MNKQYLIFIECKFTKYIFVRIYKRKPIANPPTMFYTDTRPPKVYKSLNAANKMVEKLKRLYTSDCIITVESIE